MNRATYWVIAVWLALMLSTAASTWGFSSPGIDPTLSTLAVMLISAIKIGLVMAYFMEMRTAPQTLQLIGLVWVVATSSVVVGMYLR